MSSPHFPSFPSSLVYESLEHQGSSILSPAEATETFRQRDRRTAEEQQEPLILIFGRRFFLRIPFHFCCCFSQLAEVHRFTRVDRKAGLQSGDKTSQSPLGFASRVRNNLNLLCKIHRMRTMVHTPGLCNAHVGEHSSSALEHWHLSVQYPVSAS